GRGDLPTPPDQPPAHSPPALASPSGVLATRSAERNLPVLADRDHTEIAVNVQTDRATRPPHRRHPYLHKLAVDSQRENQRDNDTDRYELKAQSRQVAGAAERKARARSPSKRPTRLRSPNQRPCAGSPDPMAETRQ